MSRRRFSLLPEHISFYRAHRYIAFEELLSKEEAALLAQGEKNQRNLWRTDRSIKKIILNPTLASLASQLFQKRRIRLAYDFYLCSPPFAEPLSLIEMSSLQGLLGGLLLKVEGQVTSPLLPETAGCGLFFAADLPLPLPQLCPGQKLLLIAYCQDTSRYTFNPQDPFTHTLKKEGYAFGDTLTHATHPLLVVL